MCCYRSTTVHHTWLYPLILKHRHYVGIINCLSTLRKLIQILVKLAEISSYHYEFTCTVTVTLTVGLGVVKNLAVEVVVVEVAVGRGVVKNLSVEAVVVEVVVGRGVVDNFTRT